MCMSLGFVEFLVKIQSCRIKNKIQTTTLRQPQNTLFAIS